MEEIPRYAVEFLLTSTAARARRTRSTTAAGLCSSSR